MDIAAQVILSPRPQAKYGHKMNFYEKGDGD